MARHPVFPDRLSQPPLRYTPRPASGATPAVTPVPVAVPALALALLPGPVGRRVAAALPPPPAAAAVPFPELEEAWLAMTAGEAGRAVAALAGPSAGNDAATAAPALLLQARAQYQARRFAAAARLFQTVRTRWPDAVWSRKAAFGLAECHAASGRFQQAEQLFAEGLAGLSPTVRQEQLARLFLRLGERQLRPEDGQEKADPARAERFFREALALDAGGPLAEQAALQLARALRRQQRSAEAADGLVAFLAGQRERERPEKRRPELHLLEQQLGSRRTLGSVAARYGSWRQSPGRATLTPAAAAPHSLP